VDFSQSEAVRDKVSGFIQANGPIHIVVNNTGGPPAGPVFDAKPEEFTTAINNHVICNHLVAQTVVPGMKEARYGRIINIISSSVKCPIPGLGVSNTTRGAVASWAKTLASELARFGITVNNILPGYITTARLKSLNERRARDAGVGVEELERRLLGEIPAGRFGTPEEVGAVVGFLASPAAGYVTGINLPVDGGRLPTL
jgi:3-oxoacyl-[acyl-carrier protein] reductase